MDIIQTEVPADLTVNDPQRSARVNGVPLDGDKNTSTAPESQEVKSPAALEDETASSSSTSGMSPDEKVLHNCEPAPPVPPVTVNAPNAKGPIVTGDVARDAIGTLLRARGDAYGSVGQVYKIKAEAHSTVGQVYQTNGNIGTVHLGPVYHGVDPTQASPPGQAVEDIKSLLDLTAEFPPHKSDLSGIEPALTSKYREVLESKRLLFIICPDRTMARTSAWSIVEEMGLTESTQRRLLDFQRIDPERSTPDFSHLRSKTDESNGGDGYNEVVVVVDAVAVRAKVQEKAQEFLDSFLGDTLDLISHRLKQHRMSMLYLVDSEHLHARLRTVVGGHLIPFPDWEINFLQSLLKPCFPDNYLEIETRILALREEWDNEKEFLCEIRQLIKDKKLFEFLESRQAVVTSEPVFNGNDPIPDTVIYVATFFPDLNAREFQRLVNLLLDKKTKTVTVTTLKLREDGTSEAVEVPKEKALVDIWEESMDEIKSRCLLSTKPDSEGIRTVSFKDNRHRAQLKQHLENECGFFVNRQFACLFSAGVLFDPSVRIGDSMVALTAAAAASDPDYYISELVLVIGQFETLTAESVHTVSVPFFAMFAGMDVFQANRRVYQRISALVQRLLGEYQLKGAVNDLLEQLMRRRLFDAVLKIVRRLRFTAGFDEVYWLKQLFERGNDDAGIKTSAYLYGYLKSLGARGYQLLTALDSWLPRQDPINKPPTTAAGEALTLLFVHCLETTAIHDPEHYGEWPSRHPLFAFRDVESAENNLGLLARWLFHPWMKCIFSEPSESESINDLITRLIFHWVIILIGPSGSLTSPQQRDSDVSAGVVQHILIDRVIAATNAEQQSQLLTSWQGMSRDIVDQIKELPYSNEGREQLIWQRNLLDDLIAEFRALVL